MRSFGLADSGSRPQGWRVSQPGTWRAAAARHRHGVRIVLTLVAILVGPRWFLIHPILEYVELSQQGEQ